MSYEIGVQVYTYRDFTIEDLCEELDDTEVTAIELMYTHLGSDSTDEEVERTLTRLEAAGIEVRGYYAGSFDADGLDEARERFSFAAELGAIYVSCDFPGESTLVTKVAEMANEYDLLVGVHNHGPGARYATVEDVQEVVADSSERIGACVDTGHFLRVGETPLDVIPVLGEHIHAVHVKDFVDEDTEVVPEEGKLDLTELVELLNDHSNLETPLTIEYEGDFADPTPAVAQTAKRFREIQG